MGLNVFNNTGTFAGLNGNLHLALNVRSLDVDVRWQLALGLNVRSLDVDVINGNLHFSLENGNLHLAEMFLIILESNNKMLEVCFRILLCLNSKYLYFI